MPPLINAIKLYDTPADKIVVDIELEWECSGGLQLGVSLVEGGAAGGAPGALYLPVVADGIRFQGVIRVVMASMLLAPPFVSCMTFAAVTPPNFDFRLSLLGGELSAIPGLREALQDYARSLVDASFVWPNRILLPFRRARNPADMYFILSPQEQEAMRSERYASLTEPRVASWGNRGLTRRIGRRYGPARREAAQGEAKKKPLLSRVLDWVKAVRSRSPAEEAGVVAAAVEAGGTGVPPAAAVAAAAVAAPVVVPAAGAETLLLDVAAAAEARRAQRAGEWGRSSRVTMPQRPVQAPMPRRRSWWRFGR